MTRIVVDAELRTRLRDFKETLEFCDDAGHVLARLLPSIDPSLYEGMESPISREELDRRKADKSRYFTTSEVLAHLEKL